MSMQRFRNSGHLSVDRNVAPHLMKAVYRIRLEVHNLRADEEEEREGKSENHVTFAMLLGNGESVRVDMAPHQTTNMGKMTVRFRNSIVSAKTVRLTDINARGCQNQFDPDRRPIRDPRSPPSSVEQVLDYLVSTNMHRYRFMYIDAQPLGCRYWIRTILHSLRARGFLRADTNLLAGIEQGQPPEHLLACQWDTRSDEGISAQIVPGIFLGTRPASSLEQAGVQQKLLTATSVSLSRLANTLDVRNEVAEGEKELSTKFDEFCQWVARSGRDARTQQIVQTSRLSYVREFTRLAGLEGFEAKAAEDLAMAAGDAAASIPLNGLTTSLAGRYSRAVSCLTAARQTSHPGDRFVYMLTAVCDMAGDED